MLAIASHHDPINLPVPVKASAASHRSKQDSSHKHHPLNWTRFKRLLRPLETSIAALGRIGPLDNPDRDITQRDDQAPGSRRCSKSGLDVGRDRDPHTSISDYRDPDWHPELTSDSDRKSKRRVYHRGNRLDRNSISQKLAHAIVVEGSTGLRIQLSGTREGPETINAGSESTAPDKCELMTTSQLWLDSLQDEECLHRALPLYRTMHRQLKEILKSTEKHETATCPPSCTTLARPHGRKSNVPTLMSICVRQLPACCQMEEDWKAYQRDEGVIPESLLDAPPTAREDIFNSLEQYGIVSPEGNWSQFCEVLRAQAAFELRRAIGKKLLPTGFIAVIISLFQAFAAENESHEIAASAFDLHNGQYRLPTSDVLWSQRYASLSCETVNFQHPLSLIHCFWKVDPTRQAWSGRCFVYRSLTQLLDSGRLCDEWLGTAQLQEVLEFATRDLWLEGSSSAAEGFIIAIARHVDPVLSTATPARVAQIRGLERGLGAACQPVEKGIAGAQNTAQSGFPRAMRCISLIDSILQQAVRETTVPTLHSGSSTPVRLSSTQTFTDGNIICGSTQVRTISPHTYISRMIAQDTLCALATSKTLGSCETGTEARGLRLAAHRVRVLTYRLLDRRATDFPTALRLIIKELHKLSNFSDRHSIMLVNPSGGLKTRPDSMSRLSEFLCSSLEPPTQEYGGKEAVPRGRGNHLQQIRTLFQGLVGQLDKVLNAAQEPMFPAIQSTSRAITEAAFAVVEYFRDTDSTTGASSQNQSARELKAWAQEVEDSVVVRLGKLRQKRTQLMKSTRTSVSEATPARRAWTWEAGLNEYVMKTPFDAPRNEGRPMKRMRRATLPEELSHLAKRSEEQPSALPSTKRRRTDGGFFILMPSKSDEIYEEAEDTPTSPEGRGEVIRVQCVEIENDLNNENWQDENACYRSSKHPPSIESLTIRQPPTIEGKLGSINALVESEGFRAAQGRSSRNGASIAWMGDDELNQL